MPPCSTKPRLTIGLFKGLARQGGRFASQQPIGLLRAALSRCILLAAASLDKPNHFCSTNSASETTLFGVKSWWIIRQPAHRLAVASPVRAASAKGKQHMRVALLLPPATPSTARQWHLESGSYRRCLVTQPCEASDDLLEGSHKEPGCGAGDCASEVLAGRGLGLSHAPSSSCHAAVAALVWR